MWCEGKADHRDTETQRESALPMNLAFLILSLSKDEATRPLARDYPTVPLAHAAASPVPILRQAQDEERVGGRESLCLCVSVLILFLVRPMRGRLGTRR